jgi:hypothetical protein
LKIAVAAANCDFAGGGFAGHATQHTVMISQSWSLSTSNTVYVSGRTDIAVNIGPAMSITESLECSGRTYRKQRLPAHRSSETAEIVPKNVR